jgi:hypothetical protein
MRAGEAGLRRLLEQAPARQIVASRLDGSN